MTLPRTAILALVALTSSVTYCHADPTLAPPREVDFVNDLIPLFTKHGCNAGACHGAAVGRGGFKLSLYGGDPETDYEAIVRQLEGRRISLSQPESSLIVRKPTENVEHGGGTILEDDSESAQLLISWIGQGAKNELQRTLKSVDVQPAQHVLTAVGDSLALRATARYEDGTTRDVTKWTIFQAEDRSAVQVDAVSAQAKVLRRGRHIVVSRYLDQVVPIEIILPLTDSPVDLSSEPRYNFIDEEVLALLTTLRLPVSPLVDDAAFIRRISLDLTGRLPLPAQLKAFRKSAPPGRQTPESSTLDSSLERRAKRTGEQSRLREAEQAKRKQLIDRLLESAEFDDYWTLQFAKLLRIRPQRDDRQGAFTYHKWIAEQIRADTSFKTVASTLIMATGDSHQYGPANFYRTVAGPREQAEFMSELFMGSRLRCANCHNHPLDRWTQDDYHGLAAIFANIDGDRVVGLKRGEVIHPRTLEAAAARIPGQRFLDNQSGDARQQLADWLTGSNNPFFAKAIVNRLWKQMMGRGLVEPADDFRATNPATHPTLLTRLADDFVANGYSLRHTLRVIANSATYARSANATVQNQSDDRFYSHAAGRPLDAEVLADAISDVLRVTSQYGDEPEGTRAVTLVDPSTRSLTLDILGRCDRTSSCEGVWPEIGLPQMLHLFNGELLNARISQEGGRLHESLQAGQHPIEIVREFYLAALSRHPSETELQYWAERLESLPAAAEKEAFLQDFVWGLMTCSEFVTNH